MYKYVKAFLDKILALIGILALAIPLLIVALAIRIDSPGPAVFKQERIGKDQKPIYIYKFRTMKSTNVAFDINNPVIKDGNKNVTKVGRIIRKFKIDEFLQLFNVIKGDMSLIGPRPLMRVYLDHYEEWEKQKFLIKPGMSCLSQVRGNGHLTSIERSYYDVMYQKKCSFKLDVEIMFKTIALIFKGEEKFLKPVPPEEIQKLREEFNTNR